MARPLVYSLRDAPDVAYCEVDGENIAEQLLGVQVEAALVPAVDLQQHGSSLIVIPAGCIASRGKTLATRLFSRVRPQRLATVWASADARTSTALARVIWAANYKRELDVITFHSARQEPPEDAEAVLLVGDAAVTDPPLGFDWQFDLSAIWHEMTGLPFVFGVWAMVPETPADCESMYRLLLAARSHGQANLDRIAAEAVSSGWPEDLALRFLKEYLEFDFTSVHRDALEEFFSLASEHQVVDSPVPVSYYEP
jgi:chorismate dehydratase